MLDGTLHLRFDAQTHPKTAARVAAWRDAMGVFVEALFKPEEREGFAGRLDFYPLGAVLLLDSFSTPYTAVRSRQVIARSGDRHVILDFFLEGGFEGLADGRPLVVGSGHDKAELIASGAFRLNQANTPELERCCSSRGWGVSALRYRVVFSRLGPQAQWRFDCVGA